jgi:hypothetical protein
MVEQKKLEIIEKRDHCCHQCITVLSVTVGLTP